MFDDKHENPIVPRARSHIIWLVNAFAIFTGFRVLAGLDRSTSILLAVAIAAFVEAVLLNRRRRNLQREIDAMPERDLAVPLSRNVLNVFLRKYRFTGSCDIRSGRAFLPGEGDLMIRIDTVSTLCGHFDQKRLDSLKAAIEGQDREAVVLFEGNELLVSFGQHLAKYVEGELSRKNGNL